MIQVEIVNGPIEFFPSDSDRQKDGAELVFNGRVRDMENGEKITRGASKLLAQIFQHEVEHLDGKLFIDRARNIEEILPKDQNEKT